MSNPTSKSPSPWLWVAGIGAGLVLLCCIVVAAVSLVYPLFTRQTTPLPILLPSEQVIPAATNPPVEVTMETPGEEPPAQTQPPSETPPNLSFDGISLYYPAQAATGAAGQIVPASEPTSDSGMAGSVYPQYDQVKFSGYPLSGTFHEPQLLVYPAAEYAALDGAAAQVILSLTQTLAEKPTAPERLPFLPLWPAAQMMHSNVEYLSFKNGNGVRFLTQYGQAAYPVNNHDLFYTFQGLTSDGKWYVAAILPVSHSSLPATGDQVPGGDFESFANNFEAYMAIAQAQLNTLANDSFTPSLAVLDAMMASLQVK